MATIGQTILVDSPHLDVFGLFCFALKAVLLVVKTPLNTVISGLGRLPSF